MSMIAGYGFARMAWELAKNRTGSYPDKPSKQWAARDIRGASHEYYRILHSAWASWPAFAGERSCGICPRVGM